MRVLDVGVLGKLGGVNDAWQSEIEKAAIRYVSGEEGGAASFSEEAHVIVKQRHEVHPQGGEAPSLRDAVVLQECAQTWGLDAKCYFAHHDGLDELGHL